VVRPADRELLGGSQHRATVPATAILGGTAGSAVGQPVGVLPGYHHAAVVADVRVGVEYGAGPAPAKAARGGRGEAGEVGVVRGGARAGGRGLEGRGEVRDLGAQLQRGGLVIEAVVGVGRVRLVGGRRHAWVARGAGRGRGLGADDRCRAVDLAEVCERDLRVMGQPCARRQLGARVPTVKSMFLCVLSLRPHDAECVCVRVGRSGSADGRCALRGV
jgi:hypothetical protein